MRIYLDEIKFRRDVQGRRRVARRILRRIDPTRRPENVVNTINAVGTVRELYFDMQTSPITLSGQGMRSQGGQRTVTEPGQAVIRWQLWTNDRDRVVIPLSQFKQLRQQLSRPDFERRVDDLTDLIMEYISTQ